eukprot:130702_1
MHLVQAIITHNLEEDKEIEVKEKKSGEMSSSASSSSSEPQPQPQDQHDKVEVKDDNTVESEVTGVVADGSGELVEEEESEKESEKEEDDEESEEDDEEEDEEEESEEEESDDDQAVKDVDTVEEEEVEEGTEDESDKETDEKEVEAKAIAEATLSANASYTPPASLLNSPSPYPLIRSVDGMSLKKYNPAPSIFTARGVPVPLRGKLNVPIHVTIGGSVVEYSVESEDYDIGFGVVAEREEGVTVVSAFERVESHIKAVTGKFLVGTVPCALIFTFDNEYSWFREKKITYQITVRPPTKENIVSGRKLRAKTALKIVSKDRVSAEERLENVGEKHQNAVSEFQRLEKELEEIRKSLGVFEKEGAWLKNRVQLRSVQEDLLNRRLTNGWEDENDSSNGNGDVNGVKQSPERAEI